MKTEYSSNGEKKETETWNRFLKANLFSFRPMTFTTQEDFVSSIQLVPTTTEEGTTEFQVLDLDFLEEIIEIQRDILNEEEKYKGTYLEDFDFEYDCDFPEIEYSDYGADLRGGRH